MPSILSSIGSVLSSGLGNAAQDWHAQGVSPLGNATYTAYDSSASASARSAASEYVSNSLGTGSASNYDPTGAYKYYDPGFTGFSGDGSVAPGTASQYDYYMAPIASKYGASAETAYQEALTNTSYQRAVDDLKAAGLNPVLLSKVSGADSFSGAQMASGSAGSVGSGGSGGSGFNSGSSKGTFSLGSNGKQLVDTVGTGLAAAAAYAVSKNVMATSMAANSAHAFLQGAMKLF